MPDYVLDRVSALAAKYKIAANRVGFYGLTYKENVDDVRESPTLQLIETMKRHLAATPKCYDPMVQKNIVENQYQDFEAFLNDIDLMVIMVHHNHLDQIASHVQNKIIFDTRNCAIDWSNTNQVQHL